MKRIFLVDTENVNITALSSANKLDKEDLIILFVTENTNVFQFGRDKLKCINTKANILKINVTTGVKNSESKNKNTDINSTGTTSLAELQASANAKPSDVSSILKNRNYSKRVREILREKGFSGKLSEAEAWLKEHNMPISNIKDVEAWIDMLQNCR